MVLGGVGGGGKEGAGKGLDKICNPEKREICLVVEKSQDFECRRNEAIARDSLISLFVSTCCKI